MSTEDALPYTEAPQAGPPDLPLGPAPRGPTCRPPALAGNGRDPGLPLTLALPGWQGEIPVLSAGPLRDEDGVEQGACLMGALVRVSHGDGSSDADVGRDDGQLLALRIQVAGVGPGLGPWGAGAGDLR